MTRLERFLRRNGIRPAALARESGYSRQHLVRIRAGKMEPTRPCIAAIVGACRRLTRETVRASHLFDVGDPKLEAVPVVTVEHGLRYADRWKDEPIEAFDAAAILKWPDDDSDAQLRVHEIEDEIETRMWPHLREAIAEAFVKAANEVLSAEREDGSIIPS